MIAHVAEAGEDRGRVVLQFATGTPSLLAIEAAIRVAQAFGSEIESLFVEDSELIALASHPIAREVSLTGRANRALSIADIEHDLNLVFAAVRRRIASLASAAEIPVRHRRMRDRPVSALRTACAECGPWNVIAIAEPVGSPGAPALAELFETVADATGVIVVGPRVARTSGPIVVAVEDIAHAPGMLRAAERIAAAGGVEPEIVIVADDAEHGARIEGELRLLLVERPGIAIRHADIARGETASLTAALRRRAAGFVIGRFGGIAIPGEDDLRAFALALDCPLFLVR